MSRQPISSRLCHWLPLLAAVLLAADASAASQAPFDLEGPDVQVKVTRKDSTLTIAQVPHLAAGDKLWVKAAFPESQSERYVMVVAFLRGATNPPPKDWFYRCEVWKKDCANNGMTVTVPDGAQQVLLFLAPETGGDFKTLVNSVRGRPGAFVRASQDLNQATLDRSRLTRYLLSVRTMNATDPAVLKDTTPLLARSLGIKVDEKCLDRIPQLQAPCLMQGQESLILNDDHSTSIVQALTSGPASDLAMAASFTPELGYGYYSPYISSVLDIARLFDSFRIANYQYIPALTAPLGERLHLTLNTPPSFRNPKSVLVAALPAVEQAQLPPLHAVDPKNIYCARKDSLVLPVQGAPLVFSTEYAHDTALRLTGKDGEAIDLPATADAAQGGFIIDTSPLGSASLGDRLQGSLHGFWGFEKFDGPHFQLVNAHAQPWSLASADETSLIVGRANTIHLQAGSVACIDRIMVKDPSGKELQADWTAVKVNEVEINVPLQSAQPGELTLLVSQYGARQPQPVELRAFPEAGRLENFTIHAGETRGTLKGSRLVDVVSLSLKGYEFLPAGSTSALGNDTLLMTLKPAEPPANPPADPPADSATADRPTPLPALSPSTTLKQGDTTKAKVTLRDGRVYNVDVVVSAPRPSVDLLSKSVQLAAKSPDSNIQLAGENQLPQDAQLVFSVRSKSPATFARDEHIEVATDDEAFSATLSVANRGIMLADSKVAIATFDPAKTFGLSAFGPLKFRVVSEAVPGDWQPLATLVRLPALEDLECPAEIEQDCRLTGTHLFLVDAVSGDPQFKESRQVPAGFPGRAFPVPRPRNGQLFLKLRDDPSVINTAKLVAEQLPPPRQDNSEPSPQAPSAAGDQTSSSGRDAS